MNRWQQELRDLVGRLESAGLAPESVEGQAVVHLENVVQAATHGDGASLERCIGQLRHFWLTAVPWCSELSRSLERVLMRYEESH